MNARKQVLVIDDDKTMHTFFASILRNFDADVQYAENGEEGLSLLAKGPKIDLLVVDIFMPVTDGLEVIRALIAQGFAGQVMIVSGKDPDYLMSGLRMAQDLGLNVIGSVQKPLDFSYIEKLLAAAGLREKSV